MHWYEQLRRYFPIEEMKSQAHIEALLKERSDVYHVDHGPQHVLVYIEAASFVFVDYLLVAQAARGQGLGRQLLDRLKAKGKPIVLEVEPQDYADTDTLKRQRFYQREGFRHAERLLYERRSLATQQMNTLEILYWCPDATTTDEAVYAHMKAIYEHIHTYRDLEFYGESYDPVHEVLTLETETASN